MNDEIFNIIFCYLDMHALAKCERVNKQVRSAILRTNWYALYLNTRAKHCTSNTMQKKYHLLNSNVNLTQIAVPRNVKYATIMLHSNCSFTHEQQYCIDGMEATNVWHWHDFLLVTTSNECNVCVWDMSSCKMLACFEVAQFKIIALDLQFVQQTTNKTLYSLLVNDAMQVAEYTMIVAASGTVSCKLKQVWLEHDEIRFQMSVCADENGARKYMAVNTSTGYMLLYHYGEHVKTVMIATYDPFLVPDLNEWKLNTSDNYFNYTCRIEDGDKTAVIVYQFNYGDITKLTISDMLVQHKDIMINSPANVTPMLISQNGMYSSLFFNLDEPISFFKYKNQQVPLESNVKCITVTNHAVHLLVKCDTTDNNQYNIVRYPDMQTLASHTSSESKLLRLLHHQSRMPIVFIATDYFVLVEHDLYF